MNTKQILIKAKGLIDSPEKWHKGGWYANNDPSCMCALMAIMRCDDGNESGHFALQTFCTDSIVFFNDHPDTTHEDIMNLFDKAIAAA